MNDTIAIANIVQSGGGFLKIGGDSAARIASITNSQFFNNTSGEKYCGGAIWATQVNLTVENSMFEGNKCTQVDGIGGGLIAFTQDKSIELIVFLTH